MAQSSVSVTIPYAGTHRHSMYSLLDGLGSPEQIVTRLKELGQTACAITDHGSAFGHVHFGTAMRAAGLRPIYGVEFYHCNNMHERGEMRSDKKEQGRQTGKLAHLTVLAQSQVGYKNLLKMYKLSYQEGFYYRPRIDWDCVVEHQEGLIVMTGCVGGLISRMIQHSQMEEAHRYCDYLSQRIEQFYVELVPCPGLEKTYYPDGKIKSPSSYEHCNQLYRIAKDLNLPMVMTDDGHFPDPSKHEAQDAAYCIGQRKKMHEERYRIAKYHHYCSGEEIMARAREVMPEVPEADLLSACAETVRIAERCDVELPRSTGPVYNIALAVEHHPGMTAFDLLARWVEDGKAYRRSLGLLPPEDSIEWQQYEERLAYELDIIRFHGFENYFLVVTDIVRWCRSQKYWCIARGSCGGSLACWYLGITQIDPMFFKLPVERFIDKTRKDMPDIDLDIDARYRDRVFTYLEEKYGKEHTAQIAALSTFRPKQAVRDVCDIYGLPQSVGQALIGLLPEIENEGGIKAKGLLHQLFRESPAAQALLTAHPELAVAADLEGQIRNQTIHAAGFIVDCNDLSEIVGIVEQPGKARVVACDMNFAAQQGLLKIDALSMETMAAVSELLDQEGHDHDWLYRLPFDDSEVYRILTEGRNTGLFQFKGQTTGRILKDLKPSNIFDLVALAALGRPGPLQSGGTREYIERKHGRMEMPGYHPKVMEVLGETYGVIVYQEQVMQLMRVAGLDWPDVHKIRKLISKSGGTQVLEQYHKPYLSGMKDSGIEREEADHLWVQCQKAGNYVFNKCLAGDTVVVRDGKNNGGGDITVEELYRGQQSRTPWGGKIRAGYLNLLQMDCDCRVRPRRMKAIYYNGKKPVMRIETAGGRVVRVTSNHRLLTDVGYLQASELTQQRSLVAVGEREGYVKRGWKSTAAGNSYLGSGFQDGKNNPSWIDGRTPAFDQARLMIQERAKGACEFCRTTDEGRYEAAHIKPLETCNGDYSQYHSVDNLRWLCNSCHKRLDYAKGERKGRWSKGLPTLLDPIVSITWDGIMDVYDIEMATDEHNFVANGVISHNSHGAQYAVHAYWTAYLKAHYAAAFACVMVNHEKKEPQQRELLREFKADGGTLQLLDPNSSQVKFSSPQPNLILGGFQCLKGVGEIAARELVERAPYKNWTDFLLKCPAALARDLQAIGLHDGRIDLDVALAIAPWFVEIVYSPYEEEVFDRMRCVTVRSVQEALHGGYAGRVVRMLGRLTDIETAISKTGNGLAERATLTVTDPTGSLPIWFAAWCWEEIKRGRDPLQGPDEGIGNSVLVTAKISNDGHRLFGEDCLVVRASRGRPVVKPKEKPSLQEVMPLTEAAEISHQQSERERERYQLLEEAQAHNAEIKRRRAGGMKRLESQVMQFIEGLG